ncbi:DUF3237 family protein [Actinoallomurus sp. NPDC052274]|uniref:DUF3237 family protein n=1 Tax=Actinoallomurus sp. NPDC052274 TaxID=3155420 RepID=UPI003420F104
MPSSEQTTTLNPEQILPALPGAPAPAGLKPLFRGVWRLAPTLMLPGTPLGTRVIVEFTDGLIQGRGVTARLKGAGADWFTVDREGLGTLDWRGRVVTDDGDDIYVYGSGRLDTTNRDILMNYGACLFETSADHLRWLNKLQGVYRGQTIRQGATGAIYHDEFFELV